MDKPFDRYLDPGREKPHTARMMIIAIKSALIESLKEAAWLCFLFCIVFSSVVIQKLTKKKPLTPKGPRGKI
jgi:hypothetical protein